MNINSQMLGSMHCSLSYITFYDLCIQLLNAIEIIFSHLQCYRFFFLTCRLVNIDPYLFSEVHHLMTTALCYVVC